VSLFEELKRRNVFRIGIAYVVAGWLIAQVLDLAADAFNAPDWVMQMLIVALLIGLPVALFLAWAYELTPDGIRRETQVERNASITDRTGHKLDFAVIGLLAIAVPFLLLDRYVFPGREAPSVDVVAETQPSIAVLPFDNRSAREEDEYFVDGMHDDILNQLAKIQSLKVISRTSVLGYRDPTRNIRDIGRELQVATILEGGVQRAGQTVRINVQLIDAATDEHLWVGSYDRELNTSNIFEIQREIATAVARELHTALSPELASRIATAPTQNIQAYDAYQKANAILSSETWGISNKAAALYQESILLDPAFASAYVKLAQIYVNQYWYFDKEQANLRRAKAALDTALNLVPEMPEALVVLADYYYKGFLDYERSLELLNAAIPHAPQLSIAIHRRAYINRRKGNLEEAIADMRKALDLDPLSSLRHFGLAQTLGMNRRFEEAMPYYDRAIELSPDDYTLHAARAHTAVEIDHRSKAMRELLYAPDHEESTSRFWLLYRWRMAMMEHNYEIAENTLRQAENQLLNVNQAYYPLNLMLALTEHFLGDPESARALFGSAMTELEAAIESLPNDPRVLAALSLSYAGLGESDKSRAAANAAVELSPISRDSVIGPIYVMNRARVLAMIGDDDSALADIELLMSVPLNWGQGPAMIRMDPAFKALHSRPEFQALFPD
jgi:TolB-like protein/Tfp pilus assembly protein PilF